MKAAIYEGPGPLILCEVEKPSPGPEDVILRVKSCGICHTDVNIVKGKYFPRHKPPLILGHELSGVVETVGPLVTNVELGDRVLVYQCITCGRCDRCKEGRQNLCQDIKTLGLDIDGGYAEFLKIPAHNLIKIPDTISFAEGSIITDALSTAFHAVRKLKLIKDEVVAVFGAGVLGLNAIQVAAKVYGAKVIAIDMEEWKLNLALKKGAWQVVKVDGRKDGISSLKTLTSEVDAAMEFIGTPQTYQQAVESVRRGGRVVLVGAATQAFVTDPLRVFKDEITITGSYASLQNDIPYLIKLVEDNKLIIKDMITHTVPLEDINRTIDMLAIRESKSLRAVVAM